MTGECPTIEQSLHRFLASIPDFTEVQEDFFTACHLSALIRHVHPAYTVIEEIVEGRVSPHSEGLLERVGWLQR
jgi:hypothetical protein